MTERALPGMDGAPACPFVAFGDDREGRSTSPDHRHRCFAESPPAPRAVAHQEAYCLSSAFPVCPTFQDWARREAAHARGVGERPETAPTAAPAGARPAMDESDDAYPAPPVQPVQPVADDPSVRRNPPRDWAAPPPWAMGSTGAGGTGGTPRPAGSTPGTPGDPAGSGSGHAVPPPEGQGLAGSAADRVAMGVAAPAAAWSASAAGSVSTPPDDELAGLVQGRPEPAPPSHSSADAYPPPTRTGRRPSVSSTRPSGDPHPGPTWEAVRRSEAYPTIRRRPRMPGLSRIALVAGAVGIAALALFMLPALLGIGGGSPSSPKPSASQVTATALPSATVKPGPTSQVYIVKKNDNMSKIAKKLGFTIEEIMAANPDIKDPNKISEGQQIVIPVAAAGTSAKPSASAKASGSAAP